MQEVAKKCKTQRFKIFNETLRFWGLRIVSGPRLEGTRAELQSCTGHNGAQAARAVQFKRVRGCLRARGASAVGKPSQNGAMSRSKKNMRGVI